MENTLIDKLPGFLSEGFYPSKAIPLGKRENAMKHYPVPAQETILGLVDATVFGSAKNGMVLGARGVYWRNDWTTKTPRNFLSWQELASGRREIGASGHKLVLPKGCVFDMSGSFMKPESLKTLLLRTLSEISRDTSCPEMSIEVPAPQQKHAAPPATAQPFEGSYALAKLTLVNQLAKRHRHGRQVHVAPAIPVYKVKAILAACGADVEPFSILVVVDNTLLQTCKDFLIVTNQEVISKGVLRPVERFALEEIRQIRCSESQFYINNYDFQCLDQLSESETVMLVDFLRELVPALREARRPAQAAASSSNTAVQLVQSAIASAKVDLERLLNGSGNPDFDQAADAMLELQGDLLALCQGAVDESISCGPDYAFHQLLLAHAVVAGFAYHDSKAAGQNSGLDEFYAAACMAFVVALAQAASSQGIYLKLDVSEYAETLEHAFRNSNAGESIAGFSAHTLDGSPEDRRAMQLARRVVRDAVEFLDQTF